MTDNLNNDSTLDDDLESWKNRGEVWYKITDEDIQGNMPAQVSYLSRGWICPLCGRGMSPFVSSCPCKDIKLEITYREDK